MRQEKDLQEILNGSTASATYQPALAALNVIKYKREQLGLSKRELGRRAFVSPAYVSALEAGNLRPSLSAFSRIAKELRFTPREIFLVVQNSALEDREEKNDD